MHEPVDQAFRMNVWYSTSCGPSGIVSHRHSARFFVVAEAPVYTTGNWRYFIIAERSP
ncbi:protein of unknown function [Hyphomicrobium sp. MC1]|nr:protein of unknown function [Hyphomicrobium sp. MC1]